ncbi:MAG: hypothetical protein H9901_00075 [Candidatus Paralactobacillus gallistercoris]|uniref:DUF536 domain-containing protein n=1 Tax=Candidatus Paralactobacillus gallistercoris TaxID=2838724 RepID=A0A948TI80_9LACO|nr:hypothetical protein [Candidatus Paralactobacillus gallistercoris]
MGKTINELVAELGVSRQRIQYIIKQLPDNLKPEKQGRNYIINAAVEEEIKKHIEDVRPKEEEKTVTNVTPQADVKQNATTSEDDEQHSVVDLTDQIMMLKNELADAKAQLQQETSTVHSMQKLLDQSQQLQLIAQNKLEQIEKKNKDLLTTDTKKDVNATAHDSEPDHQTKKPWWKFW